METRRTMFMAVLRFMGLLGPRQVPLGPGIGVMVMLSLVSLGMSILLENKLSLGGIGV